MKLSSQEVEYVAHLARLEITEKEKDKVYRTTQRYFALHRQAQ